MLAKGHNMTYSKFRVGGSAVQVLKNKYISTIQALVVTQDCEKNLLIQCSVSVEKYLMKNHPNLNNWIAGHLCQPQDW